MTSASAEEIQPAHHVSVVVGPDAPNASVSGGAFARTPNVKTPETTWPSLERACQRTVYAPRGSRGTETPRARDRSVQRAARPAQHAFA